MQFYLGSLFDTPCRALNCHWTRYILRHIAPLYAIFHHITKINVQTMYDNFAK